MHRKLVLLLLVVVTILAGNLSVQAQDTPASGKIVVWAWVTATDGLYASGVMDQFAAAYPISRSNLSTTAQPRCIPIWHWR